MASEDDPNHWNGDDERSTRFVADIHSLAQLTSPCKSPMKWIDVRFVERYLSGEGGDGGELLLLSSELFSMSALASAVNDNIRSSNRWQWIIAFLLCWIQFWQRRNTENEERFSSQGWRPRPCHYLHHTIVLCSKIGKGGVEHRTQIG